VGLASVRPSRVPVALSVSSLTQAPHSSPSMPSLAIAPAAEVVARNRAAFDSAGHGSHRLARALRPRHPGPVAPVRGDPLPKVRAPIDGEPWSVGSRHEVTWTSSASPADGLLHCRQPPTGADPWTTVAHHAPPRRVVVDRAPGVRRRRGAARRAAFRPPGRGSTRKYRCGSGHGGATDRLPSGSTDRVPDRQSARLDRQSARL
jgi:hypothetical protein